ncbi:hypothetical protein HanXRQr2_Chr17g0819211 [Helianthus annuus]|uniref:Uncharacterized protein n=1 Tax=Helianthus annuus TaxID=4232 RepID=A0A9K3DK58_HELAN|nr:hypothetical protein HanXRQr2_Chr17g0819211 [Helianthus annuus]
MNTGGGERLIEDMEMKIEETLANVCLNLFSSVLLKRPLMATAYFLLEFCCNGGASRSS